MLPGNRQPSTEKQYTMKQLKITIRGEKYPYQETMGAIMAFKKETGMEPSQISPDDTETNLKYMYHVVKYSCKVEGVEFKMSYEEFCNRLHALEYTEIMLAIADQVKEHTANVENEKK